MLNYAPLLRLLAAVFVISLGIISVSASGAQSGRRQPKSTSPAPVPTPEPTPTPKKPAEKPKLLTFIVGIDRYGSFQRLPLNTYTGIVRNCAERLDEPETVKVDVTQQEMTFGEALRRAKAEKDAYVVWLRIRPDTMGDDSGSGGDFNQVYIEYTVFAPATAKQVTTGHAYPGAYKNSTVILKPTGVNGDRYYNQAAKDVADKILNHFHVGMIKTRL